MQTYYSNLLMFALCKQTPTWAVFILGTQLTTVGVKSGLGN